MAFEGLSNGMNGIMRKLGMKTKVTEKDIKDISREIKLTLLEADVNYKVVKNFVSRL